MVLLFFLIVLSLRLPIVQQVLANKISVYFSNKTGVRASVENVYLDFTGKVVLKNVYIEDQNKDTLVFAEQVKGRLSLIKLLNKSVDINYASADNAVINVKRSSKSPIFNYQFLLDAFKNDTSNQTFGFNLNQAVLHTLSMEYDDFYSGVVFSYFLKSAKLEFNSLPVSSKNLIVTGSNIDGLFFKLDLLSKKDDSQLDTTLKKTESIYIQISDLNVRNSKFIYNNHNFPLAEKGFDVNHFNTSVDGLLNSFTMAEDSLFLSLNDLYLKNSDGFLVKSLSGKLEIPGDLMNVYINKIITERSEFNGSLVLKFPSIEHLSDSTSGIFTTTTFNEDKISIEDINYFYPEIYSILDKRKKEMFIHGTINGHLSGFSFDNAFVGFDSSNYFKGDLSLSGLPDFRQSAINANIHSLKLDIPWFLSFIKIPGNQTFNLNELGQSHVKGSLKGTFKNLKFSGLAITKAGDVNGNVRIVSDNQLKFIGASGILSGSDIHADRLIKGMDGFGKLSALAIFNFENNNLLYLESDIKKLDYNKRTLTNLSVVGSLIENKGRFQLKSSGKYVHANLWADLDLNQNIYKIKGALSELDLSLLDESLQKNYVGGDLNAVIAASKFDDLNAEVRIVNFYAKNTQSEYHSDTVIAQCKGDNVYRKISLRSDSIDAVAEGRFLMSELPKVLSREYLKEEKNSINYISENIKLNISAGKVTSLLSMFQKDVSASNIEIDGTFDFSSKTVALSGFAERFKYSKYSLENLTINTEGAFDGLRFDLFGDRMGLSNGIYLNSPSMRGEIRENTTSFVLNLYENQSNSALSMTGMLTFPGDTMILNVRHLDLKLKGEEWRSEGNARVMYYQKSLAIQNILFSQGAQKVKIHSQDLLGEGELEAQLWNLKLEPVLYFTPLNKYAIKGSLNGGLQVKGLFTSPAFDIDLIIDSLIVGNTPAGRLALVAAPIGNERHSLNFSLSGKENNAYVHGVVNKVTQLSEATGNINVDIPKLSLHFFEPFLKNYLFAMHGYMSGKMVFKGKLLRPDMKGKIAFEDRNVLGLHFTKSKYVIANQNILFNNNRIIFDNLDFRDFEGNKARVDGYILHDYFKNFNINLSLEAMNFQVMNTEKVNQAGFFGVLFADINMELKGPVNDLAINLKLTTRPKSTINIPLQTSNSEFKTPSYIIFVGEEDKSDTTEDEFHGVPINLSRFKFTGNLAITKDAQINIIVDPTNGDKISARGAGRFEVKVDQDNVPELYGSYQIREGRYTFTFASLVKKDFIIEKGSRLSWNGDIMEGLLNVKAIYTTKASRYDLISNYTTALNDEFVRSSKRNHPVTVKLNVTGELAEPELSFQIEMPESNDPFLGNIISQRINEINNDQQQLQRQVFGLIVLNRFFPEGTGYVNSGGGIAMEQANQSVSQILNSELNKIAPESIAGFDIDVNIEALSPDNPGLAQSLQFKASRQISERITITAGGNVNVGNVPNSGQFLGDYTVIYRLNSSGSVNLKFFSTTYQSYYYYYYDDITTRSGVSIQHRKSFNEFKELFK
ncbi:translocation/assembly module TamB domain-containing protein [Sporocytophaga myxococcoides]|uniref:translocation/assembly module TamB domain-containing protein n=1 Tax=Sporocytophaga myxococcoides TaxID=153721 RepID=UPI0005EFC281|nr:translocation/assembly module TamB domain-containing protein [Sporocytophaga myxococcoides]